MPGNGFSINPTMSEAATRAANLQGVTFTNFSDDANLRRPPLYFLHIYNISPRAFQVRRPPSWPLINIAPCPTGQRYVKVATLPDVIQEFYLDSNLTAQVHGTAAERWATDILNPANLGIDIWADATSWIDSGGDDLTRRGCFWSRNDPPTEDELRKARAKLEAHYRNRLEEADKLVRGGQQAQLSQEHHEAADYFHVNAPWHTIAVSFDLCPNCGEQIKPGVAFHMSQGGFICVVDWRRTVEAGARKREDVPEGQRWWVEVGNK